MESLGGWSGRERRRGPESSDTLALVFWSRFRVLGCERGSPKVRDIAKHVQ